MHSRNVRLTALLLQEVNLALRSVKDPGLTGIITVTDIKLSADRMNAFVYFSVLGGSAVAQSTAKALKRAGPFIRHVLAGRLALRVIPELEFRYDDTPRNASRIDGLLNRIAKEREGT